MASFARDQNGPNNTWRVTGVGNITRQDAAIASLPPQSSQFRAKTQAHEQEHVDDWNEKDALQKFRWMNVEEFYDRIKNFTDATQQGLVNKVIAEYNAYVLVSHPGAGTTGVLDGELRAYAAEYTVEPVGVRERSETWIRANYTNGN